MHMHGEGLEPVLDLFRPDEDRNSQLRARLVESLTRFLGEEGVAPGPDASGLAARFAGCHVPAGTASPEHYIGTVLPDLLDHSVNVASPRCLGHMSGVVPGFLRVFGELILGLNQNLAKLEASRAATVAERQLLGMLHHLVYGFDDGFYAARVHDSESCLGLCGGGGSLANIAALWCARNAAAGSADSVVVGSSLLHYSFDKAVDLLGFGRSALIRVPVDEHGALDLDELERTLGECRRSRRRVVAIVGIAGTTDSGSIDPLEELATIAARERVHFHVDAAWGGPLLFSDRLRGRLAGIERADSVTLDGHKQFCLPIGVSVLLLRNPAAARVITQRANYMLRAGSGDLGACALEGSRPALTLLLHAALHVIGRRGYARIVEEHLRRAERMADAIAASSDFELLADPETNIVLYRYVPQAWRPAGDLWSAADHERVNALNVRLQEEQFAAGRTFVSRTTLDSLPRYRGRNIVALRAVLGNPLTTDEDLAAVLDDQASIGALLAGASEVQEMRA